MIQRNQDRRSTAEHQIAAQRPCDDVGVLRIEKMHGEIVGVDGVHVDARKLDLLNHAEGIRCQDRDEPYPRFRRISQTRGEMTHGASFIARSSRHNSRGLICMFVRTSTHDRDTLRIRYADRSSGGSIQFG